MFRYYFVLISCSYIKIKIKIKIKTLIEILSIIINSQLHQRSNRIKIILKMNIC